MEEILSILRANIYGAFTCLHTTTLSSVTSWMVLPKRKLRLKEVIQL